MEEVKKGGRRGGREAKEQRRERGIRKKMERK